MGVEVINQKRNNATPKKLGVAFWGEGRDGIDERTVRKGGGTRETRPEQR